MKVAKETVRKTMLDATYLANNPVCSFVDFEILVASVSGDAWPFSEDFFNLLRTASMLFIL